MRILLLGGTGAIGVSVVNQLKKYDHEIFVTSRFDHKAQEKKSDLHKRRC